jgi:hypothetical protein
VTFERIDRDELSCEQLQAQFATTISPSSHPDSVLKFLHQAFVDLLFPALQPIIGSGRHVATLGVSLVGIYR